MEEPVTRDDAIARIGEMRREVISHPHTKSSWNPMLWVLRGYLEFIDLPDEKRPSYASIVQAAESFLRQWRAIATAAYPCD